MKEVVAPVKLPWFRPEPFGAWVRLDDRTLIAVNHELAERLGVPSEKIDGATNGPLEAHLSLTSRCFAPCTDCYLDAKPDGIMPPREELETRIQALRDLGASTIAFGGGEPLLRDDLGELAIYARSLGLVPVMTTSGLGLTEKRASDLRSFAQINVSHDGVGGGYSAVRGFEGARAAEHAIELLVRCGIAVGANVVITKQSFPFLLETAKHMANLGAGELQLLRFKPRGRAARMEYLDKRLTTEQVAQLWSVIQCIVDLRRLSVRIDCALVPLLSPALVRLDEPGRLLGALGVFGCEAARHLGAVDAHGRVMACSFSEASSPAPDLADAWVRHDELERFRAYHASPDEPCRSCVLRSVCRGGCQVVSRHSTGIFGPDPECPQVLRHRRLSEVPT
ncbi:MAG TPA: radical SAM protein [Polyangium sp.]|nr:radical SAM protein [Polyangium sp.]